METYKVICTTDQYHASRHSGFDREGIKVMKAGLTLKEAQKELTSLYNSYYDSQKNWGLIVSAAKRNEGDESNPKTFQDGTRSFQHDVFTFSIEIEEN